MSNAAQEWAKKQQVGNPGAKFVLWVLADYAGPDGGSCFPTIESICNDTEQGERTVSRHLDLLETLTLIKRWRERRPDGTLGRYNYRLNMAKNLLTAEPLANLATGSNHLPKTTKPPANLAAQKPSLEPSIKKQNAASREDFLREIDKERLAGRFAAITDNETLIHTEGGNAWDYWEAYPDKKPSGDLVAGFIGWLRQSRAIKTLERVAEKKVAAGGSKVPEPSNVLQSWHERIARKFEPAVFRTWIRPLVFDGKSVLAPTQFFRDWVLTHYRHEIEAEFYRGVPIIVGQIPTTETKEKELCTA